MEWVISLGIVIAGIFVFLSLLVGLAWLRGGKAHENDFWVAIGFIIFMVASTYFVHDMFFTGGK